MLKKIITTILILLCFAIFQSTFSDYNNFINELQMAGFETENIQDEKAISRYELTRLLNAVECKDCLNAPQRMTQKYTNSYRNTFKQLPNKDFDDIEYQGGVYNGEKYYYCVAYVGENNYMRGYPANVSPICNGLFCGQRNTSYAEFYEVITNLLFIRIQKQISINWKDIAQRLDQESEKNFINYYFTNNEKKIIQKLSNRRDQVPQNKKEFDIYMKYCTFNIEACGFQEFRGIKKGYWPIAELNILHQEGILNTEQIYIQNMYKAVPGNYVISVLYNIFEKTNCNFDYDYDCDEILNNYDNCPNTYNPSQKDLDKDNIGDVCDNDIDGDGIINTKGIVDETGNIDISKRDENEDNCILDKNKEQTDSNDNRLGDICETGNNIPGISIKIKEFNSEINKSSTEAQVSFQAQVQGDYDSIQRDLGDGHKKTGIQVSHTYFQAGLHTITATAYYQNTMATASSTIFIGKNMSGRISLSLKTKTSNIQANQTFILETKIAGNFDSYIREFPNGNKTSTKSKVSYMLREGGSYYIRVKGVINNKIQAVASLVVPIGDDQIGSYLHTNIDTPKVNQKVIFQTKLQNIGISQIKDIIRDTGDGKIVKNRNLIYAHSYTKHGGKVIKQKIILRSGQIINNYITIFVIEEKEFSNYSLTSNPNTLKTFTNKTIVFNNTFVLGPHRGQSFVGNYMPGEVKTYTQDSFDNINHKYLSANIYQPIFTIYIDECIALSSHSSIVIDNQNICLRAKLNGTLAEFKCDMDADGIPDLCDIDIDGDGEHNPLGMIKFEQDDCSYSCENLNFDTMENYNLYKFLQNKKKENRCLIDSNPLSHKDGGNNEKNLDGLIRECIKNSSLNENTIKDQDRDGIEDLYDLCDDLPESYNGIQDYDGCPEPYRNNCIYETLIDDDGSEDIGPYSACNYNAICENTENCACQDCINYEICNNNGGPTQCNQNNACEANEDCTCADCDDEQSVCNNGFICDIDIQDCTCDQENNPVCETCGNGIQDPGENCNNCPQDSENCDTTESCNNNGLCEANEDCTCADCDDFFICTGGTVDDDITGDDNITTEEERIGEVENCFACPCHYLDFAGDLSSKDSIQVQLLNLSKTTLYSHSSIRSLSSFLYNE